MRDRTARSFTKTVESIGRLCVFSMAAIAFVGALVNMAAETDWSAYVIADLPLIETVTVFDPILIGGLLWAILPLVTVVRQELDVLLDDIHGEYAGEPEVLDE